MLYASSSGSAFCAFCLSRQSRNPALPPMIAATASTTVASPPSAFPRLAQVASRSHHGGCCGAGKAAKPIDVTVNMASTVPPRTWPGNGTLHKHQSNDCPDTRTVPIRR